jgi:NAD(P)-dependent dehydrogenase (short-subunit alcohol dehydrogenase family)
MYDLRGQIALVTGAGGRDGIGRAIAERLAKDGADVVVNDIQENPRDASRWGGLSEVVREIEGLGGRSVGLGADVSVAEQVDEMIRSTAEAFGSIDILVNNAGVRAGRDRVLIVELDEAVWDEVQRVNAKGPFLQCGQRCQLAG